MYETSASFHIKINFSCYHLELLLTLTNNIQWIFNIPCQWSIDYLYGEVEQYPSSLSCCPKTLIFCVAFHKTWCTWGWVRLQPWGKGCRRGRAEVVGGKQTPYGLEELEFLANLQDADPEHWKVEPWHRSDWFCSAADVQRSAHGYEDKNSLLWSTAWRNCSEFKSLPIYSVPCQLSMRELPSQRGNTVSVHNGCFS